MNQVLSCHVKLDNTRFYFGCYACDILYNCLYDCKIAFLFYEEGCKLITLVGPDYVCDHMEPLLQSSMMSPESLLDEDSFIEIVANLCVHLKN